MRKINTFIINGFLESGKTSLIDDTIKKDGFSKRGATLLICCEEGIEEYDEFLLANLNVNVVYINKQEDFNKDNLDTIIQRYDPDRIIIEFNGMWDITEVEVPDYLNVGQIITMIDSTTFEVYFNNMRQKMVTMIQNSDAVIFNRANQNMNLVSYKRNVKLANPNMDVVFEGTDGLINSSFEEDLPYNVHDKVIEIKDEDFGIWYIDALEQVERYNGKYVKFTAETYISKELPKNHFVPGRTAMTCCSDDLTVLGFVSVNETDKKLKDGSWAKFTAKIEYKDDLEGQGPLLHIVDIEQTFPIEEPITKF